MPAPSTADHRGVAHARAADRSPWAADRRRSDDGPTVRPGRLRDALFSADATVVAFVSDRDEPRGIWLHDAATGASVLLGAAGEFTATLGDAETPERLALSADGTRIAFVATSPAGTATLHLHDRATGTTRTIAGCFDPPVDEVALSADGGTVIYRSGAALHGHVVATGGAFVLPVAAARAGPGLSISADGTRVAFAGLVDGAARIGLHDRADGTTRWVDTAVRPNPVRPAASRAELPARTRVAATG